MVFGGKTYSVSLDYQRLATQLGRVWRLMVDGEWRTLQEIHREVGGSEAGISARIRDFRKPQFGGYEVDRRRRGNPSAGLWEYRLVVKPKTRRKPKHTRVR